MKTLVKTKIVLDKDRATITLLFWKRVFWIFGYWYPFGTSIRIGGKYNLLHGELNWLNDDAVSKVLYDGILNGER